MVRRARNDWIFSGEAARQLIAGGDGAVASQPQPASRDGAVVVDRPWRAPLEHSEQRTPRQTRYEDAYGEDELGARHRCTEAASAEHGGQDGRRWEPASREHGFGRPALAQRSGGRASREIEMIDDRERSVHNPRDCSARAMLSQRQQQQLATINSVTSRSPRATKESMPTEAEWPQEQPAAAATRGRRASKELMLAERKERLDGLMITAEDYGYTERHLSPRQRHYNAMARVDAEQAKQFGLQAAPFGLHGFGERPAAQSARDHYDGRPREAHYDSRQPAQPLSARASHDKREDDAGRCGAPPPHLTRLVAAVAAVGCPRARSNPAHTDARPRTPTRTLPPRTHHCQDAVGNLRRTCACLIHGWHSHRTVVLGVLLAGACTSHEHTYTAWHEPDLADQ